MPEAHDDLPVNIAVLFEELDRDLPPNLDFLPVETEPPAFAGVRAEAPTSRLSRRSVSVGMDAATLRRLEAYRASKRLPWSETLRRACAALLREETPCNE